MRVASDIVPKTGKFEVVSDFQPSGDQPTAIDDLERRIRAGQKDVVLLGATGTGKSATAAWLIERLQRPTLVMAPNKTLAAQLANELREMLPNNAVEYFVSYYDYYQPEAYVPQTDTYIEKDSSINSEVERLRHSATNSLLTRRDVVVVATVSCIYGLGTPQEYVDRSVRLHLGQQLERDLLLRHLVGVQYTRNDLSFTRGTFRVRGDTVEIFPMYEELAIRVEMFGDDIERLYYLHPLTGEVMREVDEVFVFPASHYTAGPERMARALRGIELELADRLAELEKHNKLLEAQRLRMRTTYDIEMMRQVGFCSGIENYSRHIDGRAPGSPPNCLLDYFPDDFLLVMDESHNTVPQTGGMYEGDMSRKRTLVEHGFRLPSAMDNRPLKFEEFVDRIGQTVYLSATPGPYELGRSRGEFVEQVIRPTGLVDPEVIVKPTKGQIDDLVSEIRERAQRDERVLVTTLTKKMAEDLTDYLLELGSESVTCTPRSTRCDESSCSGSCGPASSTSWSESTCFVRGSTFQRYPWCPSWTPTKRASCAVVRRSSRRSDARPAMCPARCTCTPTRSPRRCSGPSTRPTAVGPSRSPSIPSTVSIPSHCASALPTSRTCSPERRPTPTRCWGGPADPSPGESRLCPAGAGVVRPAVVCPAAAYRRAWSA